MTSMTSASKKSRMLLLLGILMIATTLRVTFTGAAPLLDMVRDALALSTAQIGILTTLPLLASAEVRPDRARTKAARAVLLRVVLREAVLVKAFTCAIDFPCYPVCKRAMCLRSHKLLHLANT